LKIFFAEEDVKKAIGSRCRSFFVGNVVKEKGTGKKGTSQAKI
jgi:hypothetical protein